MTIIYCARHGETEWNAAGRIQGLLDVPLSALGRLQAEALGRAMQRVSLDAIYSSDLSRAMQTAACVARGRGANGSEMEIVPLEKLREWHMGDFQGHTFTECESMFPEEFHAFMKGVPDVKMPKGESANEKDARAVACFEDLARKHPNGTIFVATHGGLCTSFLQRALGLPPGRPKGYRTSNAAIHKFELTPDRLDSTKIFWRLLTWGDESHLDGLLGEARIAF